MPKDIPRVYTKEEHFQKIEAYKNTKSVMKEYENHPDRCIIEKNKSKDDE